MDTDQFSQSMTKLRDFVLEEQDEVSRSLKDSKFLSSKFLRLTLVFEALFAY